MEGGDQGRGWREEKTSSKPSRLRTLRVSVSLMIPSSKPSNGTHVLESRRMEHSGRKATVEVPSMEACRLGTKMGGQ